jgi:hypothetical protein
MLQSPTIFKQTVEGSKAGFDSLVSLVQTEANTFKQNRLLAAQQAQKAAEMGAKFQYDVAMEQTKAQIQASAPPSATTVWLQERRHEEEYNKLLRDNPNAAERLGVSNFNSRWIEGPNGTGTMLLYTMVPGQEPKPYTNPTEITETIKLYSEAEEAIKTMQTLQSAGLATTNIPGYLGSPEINILINGLKQNEPDKVRDALEQYRLSSGRLPALNMVQDAVKAPTQAQSEAVAKVISTRGSFRSAFDGAMPYLSAPKPGYQTLGYQDLHTKPVAEIQTIVNLRYNDLVSRVTEKPADATLRAELLSVKNLKESIDTLLENYPLVPGFRPADYNELYINEDWNKTDASDIFVTPTQRNAIRTNTPLSSSTGANNNYNAASTLLVNGLSQ